jgi:hypothetical protein
MQADRVERSSVPPCLGGNRDCEPQRLEQAETVQHGEYDGER